MPRVITFSVLALLMLLIPGAFILGRETHSRDGTPNMNRPRVYTLEMGDTVLVPQAATRCQASAEGGFPNLFCERMPSGSGRNEFVFYKDSVTVWSGPEEGAGYNWRR